ncbi:DUF5134 domain-containing protein [Leifsonia sp. L25]|uniref:DUF5134 domain-containing protein n=1 Tax=Actinomycetes TaxID=1760 RepID=UPI003D689C1F
MMYPGVVAMVIAILFGIGGAGYLTRAIVGHPSLLSRISDVLHVLLAGTMITMALDANMLLPPIAQLIVFGPAVVYYVILAIVARSATNAHELHGGRALLCYHAVMMSAMVVMAVQMLQAGTHLDGTMDMDASAVHPMTMASAPGWGAVGIVAAVFFGAGALLFLVRLFAPAAARANVTGDRVNSFLLLSMSAGMCLAFLPW